MCQKWTRNEQFGRFYRSVVNFPYPLVTSWFITLILRNASEWGRTESEKIILTKFQIILFGTINNRICGYKLKDADPGHLS
jgi:hypothetical protein